MDPSANNVKKQAVDLSKQLRTKEYLLRAWQEIRNNGNSSSSEKTKAEIRKFESDLPGRLRSIRERLRAGYKFSKQVGRSVPKDRKNPDKGKRPLVIAKLEDRIVQRAILEVLYDAKQFAGLQAVLTQPTSAGGLKGRNVDFAIEIIQRTYEAGDAKFIAGSDISGFFTRINVAEVVEFVRSEIGDDVFADLFASALAVDLENARELTTKDLEMFPTPGVGVAQGCPLSALAGNIALRDFDALMNERGIVCVRYIDDFAILGKKRVSVERALASAARILKSKKMEIYDPQKNPGKAFIGAIGDDLEFLGYKIIPGLYPPAMKNQRNLIRRVDDIIRDSKTVARKAERGKWDERIDRYYAQALDEINMTVSAWRKSFKASHCVATAKMLDGLITERVTNFMDFYQTELRKFPAAERRRLAGVRLIGETMK